MVGAAGLAGGASPTGAVDVADDPLADQVGVGGIFDDAHELVAQDAGEAHVAPDELEVGGADPGQANPDPSFALAIRRRVVEGEAGTRGAEDDCAHAASYPGGGRPRRARIRPRTAPAWGLPRAPATRR